MSFKLRIKRIFLQEQLNLKISIYEVEKEDAGNNHACVTFYSPGFKHHAFSCFRKKQNSHISGQTLDDIGTKFNMTLLRVIGKAIKNLEKEVKEQAKEICRQHSCGDWTMWSECDVSADKYRRVGAQMRSRECGKNTTNCERYGISREIFDYQVCETRFICPKEYIITKHGFCIRYYASLKPWDDAEATCRNDGGDLVRVDSEMKVTDVNNTLLAHLYIGDAIWIDGRRSKQAGPWSYGYKATNQTFTYWGDNDPDNRPNELCMMYHRSSVTKNLWRWFDHPCDLKTQFICQIASN